PSAEVCQDPGLRDRVEAEALFGLLERQIAPLFYRRDDGGIPKGWLQRIKVSLRSLGPQVTASRMLRDYVEKIYGPASAAARPLSREV
ncbi:MAG: DUF3417 domain-containing protein, partial [Candidatus Methylomirabilales bacterium]